MNRRMILNTVGLMLKVEAALLLLPAIAALIWASPCIIGAIACMTA